MISAICKSHLKQLMDEEEEMKVAPVEDPAADTGEAALPDVDTQETLVCILDFFSYIIIYASKHLYTDFRD